MTPYLMNYIALNYRRLTVYYDRIQRISYWSIRKILFQEVCYLYAKRIYFWFGNGIAFDFYADENFSNIFNILRILCGFAYAMIAVRIKTPKGRKEITPKRIYVIDNNLICISDKQSESRGVELVKTAYDYGEFYFLSFPMGKKSGNFVCQKDLLTQGTLEEFEKLFDGKIVRKY